MENGWYHVSARGDRRQTVFADDTDCRWFLGMVAELAERFGVEVHAFTLRKQIFGTPMPIFCTACGFRLLGPNGVDAEAFFATSAEELAPRTDCFR